ncbi:hypothetical protein ZHAS_00010704 [Anopheles sinensis]|uniref:Uncharacterized protein n=1 Tax=Anopheles sinensis TaxID=74873 RepID=A0A084VYI6_ANOSI|nr:hypothetical protein ZHAS_00010704 [Anopheles sinensis]
MDTSNGPSTQKSGRILQHLRRPVNTHTGHTHTHKYRPSSVGRTTSASTIGEHPVPVERFKRRKENLRKSNQLVRAGCIGRVFPYGRPTDRRSHRNSNRTPSGCHCQKSACEEQRSHIRWHPLPGWQSNSFTSLPTRALPHPPSPANKLPSGPACAPTTAEPDRQSTGRPFGYLHPYLRFPLPSLPQLPAPSSARENRKKTPLQGARPFCVPVSFRVGEKRGRPEVSNLGSKDLSELYSCQRANDAVLPHVLPRSLLSSAFASHDKRTKDQMWAS